MAKAKTPKKTAQPDGRPTKRSVRTIEIAGSLPCDLDTAGIALEQAAGILEVLASATECIELPNTHRGALSSAINTASALVRQADVALFGEGAK